jgi:hypothetical protein
MGWKSVAVAVAGSKQKPCEDSALATDRGLIVVADGLGSTGFGAQASAHAVAVAAALQDRIDAGDPQDRLAEALHDAFVAATAGDRRMATTCLLAMATANRLIVGGVGDGLILTLRTDGEAEHRGAGRGEFANETQALPRSAPKIESLFPKSYSAVMLASDGVADDLTPGSEGHLASGWADVVRREGVAQAEKALRAWLTDWKTPGSHDDRSVALLVYVEEP